MKYLLPILCVLLWPIVGYGGTQVHATDCTSLTCDPAQDGEFCYEEDADKLYVCEGNEGAGTWQDVTGAGGGGAPTDADYLVGTANGSLSAEIVAGTSPGGELGGTWGTPTVDATHSGSAHHAESHTVSSHSDTTATGAELETLTDTSDADSLHTHGDFGDYLPLSGGTMVGETEHGNNIISSFGTGGLVDLSHNGSNFLIDNGTGDTDITGGIRVSEGESEFSMFGADPTSLNPSDDVDVFVARKARDDATNKNARGALFVMDIEPTAQIDKQFMGLNAFVYTHQDNAYANTYAIGQGGAVAGRYAFRHKGSGLYARGGGVSSQVVIASPDMDGTITDAYAFLDEGGDGGVWTGSITDYKGLWILDSIGYVNTKVGVHIEDQDNPSATTKIGIQIDGADDYALWLGAGSAVTTAADGITFGSGTDVNLYRSAANTLKTDDSIVAVGTLTHNTTELVASHDDLKDSKCTYIENPSTDDEFFSIWRAPLNVTITEIWCETDAGTILLDLEVDDGTPTGVKGSDITCDTDGQTDGGLAGDTALVDGETLDLDLGTVTTAVRLSVCFEYTVD